MPHTICSNVCSYVLCILSCLKVLEMLLVSLNIHTIFIIRHEKHLSILRNCNFIYIPSALRIQCYVLQIVWQVVFKFSCQAWFTLFAILEMKIVFIQSLAVYDGNFCKIDQRNRLYQFITSLTYIISSIMLNRLDFLN